jgi:predicted MFS family arabinose efflux permease
VIGLLRDGDFRLLWTGQLLSGLGSWLLVVAVPYRVFQLTGSPAATGLTFVIGSVPSLALGPVAGLLVDRWDRRRTMLAVDLGRAGSILPLLLVREPRQLWVVYASLLVESALTQLFDPAAQALVPAMVGRGPELPAANALLSVVAAGSRLAGAALGGVVLAAGGLGALVAIDAATYVASAVSLALLRWRPARHGRDRVSPGGSGAEALQGLRHVIASRRLRGLLAVTVIFLAGNGAFTAVLVPYVRLRLHGAAGELGLLLAATGAGFLAGAPIGRAILDRVGPRATAASSLLAAGGSFLAWFGTGRLAPALALAALTGAAATVFQVCRRTHLQVLTPDRLLGRTSATFITAEATATLAGTALGGGAAGLLGLTATVDAAAVAILASAALAAVVLGDGRDRPER